MEQYKQSFLWLSYHPIRSDNVLAKGVPRMHPHLLRPFIKLSILSQKFRLHSLSNNKWNYICMNFTTVWVLVLQRRSTETKYFNRVHTVKPPICLCNLHIEPLDTVAYTLFLLHLPQKQLCVKYVKHSYNTACPELYSSRVSVAHL